VRAPEGYVLEKCCIASPRSEVYTARRERDGAEVVLKTYPEQGSRGASRVIEREFELLRSLEPGVGPLALALEQTEEHPVLVLERLSGQALRGPLPVERFLALAVQMARAVSRVHTARIVHRNLRPENVLVHAESGQVRLIGFGRAAPLGAPSEIGGADHALDGPLLYMAPEQTGRLERGVDFRSDLYALGATFYELLSGRPPFDARDPLDLIHAHIAHRARPVVELTAGIPGTLSRIIMKLLEKEPEDRYQTAEALDVDLETCREQLERSGAIDDELPLGSADAPYRPLFRRRIYGRAAECETLQRAYRRATDGAVVLLLVRGAPGIGKSALVPELHRPLALDGGYLGRGKFDLYRGHLPYAGFTHALQFLMRQLATESEARRRSWREDLGAALGKLSGVVAELVPELRALLGEVAPVPRLEPRETQQRLALAVRRFLLGAARHARPLVLFLDDLQWADAGSRYLLEEMLACGESAPLLVIGSYRDNEVGPGHPLQQLLERIERRGLSIESVALGPLSAEAGCEMLADALGKTPDLVRDLAERVARHSGNNPLLIQQCVYHLHQLGCIHFAPREGWTWDLEAAEAAVIPGDPVGMMLAKLQRLRAETRSVAQFASCVGDEFDVELLAELSRRERGLLDAALYELSDEGLIAPCRAGFRFVHDRIREAAQALLPETQRVQLHLRTAQLLLERLSEDEQRRRCFEIADHLTRAAAQIPADMRLRTIDIQRTAGMTALQSGASASAAHYLTSALALLCAADWSARGELAFDLHLRASECAYQTRDFERALALLAPLEERPLSAFQRGLVAVQRIKVYQLSRSVQETLDLTEATLARFGQRLHRRPSWLRTRWALARTDWLLRGSEDTWKFRPASSRDRTWMIPMLVRSASGQALGLTSVRLMCLSCADAVRSMLKHGYPVSPARILAAYAGYRAAFLKHARGIERYAEAALAWSERAPDVLMTPQAEWLIHACASAWTRSRHELLEPLHRVVETLREAGDLEYSANALLIRAHYMGLCGVALREVVDGFASLPSREHLTPIEQPRAVGLPYRVLSESRGDLAEFDEARAELARYAGSAQFAATHWMLALCVFGRFADAWWTSELVRPIIFERLSQTTHVADHALLRGLAAAACAGDASGLRRWSLLRWAARSRRYLARLAEHGPDFVHMALLLEAEQMRARGRSERALELYERAVGAAERCHHIHHAALAHERRAGLLRSLGRATDADAARARALALYAAWGAEAKLRQPA
jgi:hypothetical protein